MSTPAGQKVTINEASSTTYRNGTSSSSANAIRKGERVLVLGTTNGTNITASQVIVQPSADGGAATSSAAGVLPFQRGAPSTSKQVGQIPATYSQGSGTIVSGTEANKATEAALAAYPGGVVDRVVKLSNGEYEVHNIGVNWPHHIFVNQNFKVVGADEPRSFSNCVRRAHQSGSAFPRPASPQFATTEFHATRRSGCGGLARLGSAARAIRERDRNLADVRRGAKSRGDSLHPAESEAEQSASDQARALPVDVETGRPDGFAVLLRQRGERLGRRAGGDTVIAIKGSLGPSAPEAPGRRR